MTPEQFAAQPESVLGGTPSPAIPDGERLSPALTDEAVDIAAKLSVVQFPSIETPLILDIVRAALVEQDKRNRPPPARESVRVTDAMVEAAMAQFYGSVHWRDMENPEINCDDMREILDEALRVEPAAQPAYRAVTLEDAKKASALFWVHQPKSWTDYDADSMLSAMQSLGLVVPVGEPGGKGGVR